MPDKIAGGRDVKQTALILSAPFCCMPYINDAR